MKLTFARGASLKDGRVRRAIDIHEGEEIDAFAFEALVRQAIALNGSGKPRRSRHE